MSVATGLTSRLARTWVRQAVRFAPAVVVAHLALTVVAGWYAATHLGVNTSTADMISERLVWRQAFAQFREAFPQLDHNLVVVIDAGDADQADAARDAIAAALVARDDLFEEIFAPGADAFFRRHAFLYLEPGELNELADDLARVQPFLGRLAADPTLAGLFGLLDDALQRPPAQRDATLGPLLERIAAVSESVAGGNPDALSWQALMRGEAETPARRVILLKPALDFARLQPARDAIAAVRDAAEAADAEQVEPVSVRLTGPVALEHEELDSVTRGVRRAGGLALATVLAILVIALRSVRLVVAALLTLVVGLVATAAFAALAVGALNLISIAFAVLYIGLGIDFAIHYCLRVREALAHGTGIDTALIDSAGDVGASLVLCAVTTSIGFFAFFPTTFRGVSELGLISGTGMYISVFVTLTLLPALLKMSRLRFARAPTLGLTGVQRIARHRAVWPVTAVALLAALAALPFVRFDSDPLNLRDAQSESVATFRALADDPQLAPRTLSVIAPDEDTAAVLAGRLEALDTTARVARLEDFVPTAQTTKLAVIDELSWLLGPDLAAQANPEFDSARAQAAVAALGETLNGVVDLPAAARLASALDTVDSETALQALERALVGTLPARLEALGAALQAGEVTRAQLPSALHARWVTPDGRPRLEVYPSDRLTSDATRERFVDTVRATAPAATGLAVVQVEAARAVVRAFAQAFVTAFVLIALVLVWLLRGWRDVAVVLVPMAGAGLVTVGIMVAFGIEFNFANVIALPLLLGVGVDNGIHMVSRWHHLDVHLLESSTARAVLFSALTTIASFGNLAFSGHPGSASMGQVLTIGMIATTLCTLVLIPAMLERRSR